LLAAWMPGRTKDGIAEARSDITLPGAKADRAWVIDLFNGTEQELNTTTHNHDTIIRRVLVKDYPTFIRMGPTPES
jgi:hypothetical protein